MEVEGVLNSAQMGCGLNPYSLARRNAWPRSAEHGRFLRLLGSHSRPWREVLRGKMWQKMWKSPQGTKNRRGPTRTWRCAHVQPFCTCSTFLFLVFSGANNNDAYEWKWNEVIELEKVWCSRNHNRRIAVAPFCGFSGQPTSTYHKMVLLASGPIFSVFWSSEWRSLVIQQPLIVDLIFVSVEMVSAVSEIWHMWIRHLAPSQSRSFLPSPHDDWTCQEPTDKAAAAYQSSERTDS